MSYLMSNADTRLVRSQFWGVLVVAGLGSCLCGQVNDTYFKRESGNWHTASDWTRGVPNSDVNARFWSGSYPESQRITIDRNATVKRLIFEDALPDSGFDPTNDPLSVIFSGENSPTLTINQLISVWSSYASVGVKFKGLNIEMGNGINFGSFKGSNDATTGPDGGLIAFRLEDSTLRTDYPTGIIGSVYNTAISLSNSVWSDLSDDSAAEDGFLNLREGSSLTLETGSRMALDFSNTGVTSVVGTASITGDTTQTGNIELRPGSTLIFGQQDDTRSKSAEVSGNVLGDGAIVINGPNYHLSLTGSNSFSGGLYLEDGVTRVSRGGNTGAIDNTIHFDGGELQFLEADNFYTSTWNVKADSTISTDSGLVEAVIYGDFTGNSQLEIKGAGKVFLRGNNSAFTGDFLVSEGQLVAGVNNSLGSQTTVTVNEGATFRLEGNEDWGSTRGDGTVDIGEYNARVFTTGTDTLEGPLRGSGTFTMAGTGEVRLGSLSVNTSRFTGDLAVTSGQLELNGFSVGGFGGTMTTSGEGVAEFNTRSANLTFNGTLDNDGRLLKTGSGTLTVDSSASGGSGVVEVAQGTLRAIGRIPGGTLEMSGGTFQAGSNSLTVENLIVSPGKSTVDTGTNSFFMRNLSGTGTLTKIGTGTMRSLASSADWSAFSGSLIVNEGTTRIESMANANLEIGNNGTAEFWNETTDIGSLAGSGTLRIRRSGNAVVVGHDNTSSQFSGSINGNGTLHKTGTGTLTLTGEIGSSNLSVDQGIVRLASATATRFGSGNSINVAANSELHIDQEFTFRGALTGTGSVSLSDGAALVTFQEDAGVFDGDIYIGSGRNLSIADSFDFGGSLTGQGNVQLSAGTAAVTFRGNNESYAGTVSVGSGRTLNVGRSGSLGSNTSVEIASGGTVQLEGAEYWGGLSGHGSLDLKGFNGRIGQGNQHSVFSGQIIGSGDFAKVGAGDFSFNGDASGLTGDFTVMDGTLSGSGLFGGLVIDDGATLAIGNSPGRITTDSFTLDTGALLEIELGGLLAGTEFDQFVVLGDASISGNLSISLYNGFQLSAGQEFLIGDIRGDLMGQFAGLGEGGLVGTLGDQDLFVSYKAGNGNSIGLFTAVPEPNSALLLLLGAGLVSARRNRRI